MKAIRIRSIGGSIEWTDVPRPMLPAAESISDKLASASLRDKDVGAGMVVVSVRMAGISYSDYLGMHGKYEKRPKTPMCPGSEACGVVVAVINSAKFKINDKVGVVMPWTCGTCAEELLLHGAVAASPRESDARADREPPPAPPADYQCVKLPDTCGMKDFSEFVSLGSDYVTAYFALGHRTRPILKTGWDGKALAVLGANGGVGVAAVEVGKVLGAFTLRCTTKTDGDVRKSAAPDGVVDVSRRGWHDRVLEARPGGVDIVFDPVGGDYIFSVLRCMKVGGALLTVGFASGKIPTVSPLQYPKEMEDSAAQVAKLWVEGRVTPDVTTVLPMDKFRNGIAMLVVRDYRGKVCLSMDPDYAAKTPSKTEPTIHQAAQSRVPDVDAPDAASLMRYFPGESEDATLEEAHTGAGIHGDY
ncbi:oxidoreductase [Aureococcus anophagefferens]|uniref:Oxidoreductase n=1 Tax=Aureococcus anophagefferens TaxID=44056 RepID=A0ABR1G1G2_AURAN